MRQSIILNLPYVLGILWILMLLATYTYFLNQERDMAETIVWLFYIIQDYPYSPLLYIAFYIVQPLLFFPSTLLTIIGGTMFGVQAGLLYAFLGANLSVLTAYTAGMLLKADYLVKQPSVQKWTRLLREKPFFTTLFLRLLFVPFDVFNYSAGVLRIKLLPFWLATMLGTSVAIASFVTIGASLEWQNIPNASNIFALLNKQYLLAAILMFGFTLLTAYLLKRTKYVKF